LKLLFDFPHRIELKDRNTPTTLCDQFIERWIPSALLSKKVVANEVKYSLPHSEVANFPPLFAEFEDHIEKESGTIRSYDVSMTTLEEVCLISTMKKTNQFGWPLVAIYQVFLKISADEEVIATSNEQDANDNSSINPPTDSDELNLIGDFGDIHKSNYSGFFAMCKLRILRILRTPGVCFLMIILPIALTAYGFSLAAQTNFNQFPPQMINFAHPDGSINQKQYV